MIVNFSLIVIFLCFVFIVLSPKIETKWFAKFVMCQVMISIIGVFASKSLVNQDIKDISVNLLCSGMAFLVVMATNYIYKRGGFK